jgi:hypothetical protein
LILLNYDKKTNFVLDHYEPRHVRISPNGGDSVNQPVDYNMDEADENRNIYTLVYLNSFELHKNESTDNYGDLEISCRLSLIVPTGLIDQHTIIISERLESLISLELIVNDEDGPVLRNRHQHKRRGVSSQLLKNRLIKQRNFNHPSLYELELIEGPLKLNKNDFNNLNSTCRLVLRDYDESIALDTITSSVLVSGNNNKRDVNLLGAPNSAYKFQNSLIFLTIFCLICAPIEFIV